MAGLYPPARVDWPVSRVLIHGRLDLSCPLDTAWELARRGADQHRRRRAQGNPGERAASLAALGGFARR